MITFEQAPAGGAVLRSGEIDPDHSERFDPKSTGQIVVPDLGTDMALKRRHPKIVPLTASRMAGNVETNQCSIDLRLFLLIHTQEHRRGVLTKTHATSRGEKRAG